MSSSNQRCLKFVYFFLCYTCFRGLLLFRIFRFSLFLCYILVVISHLPSNERVFCTPVMPLEYLPCAQQFTNMSALKFVLYSHTPQRLMPERKVSLFSWVLVLLARMRYQQLLPVSGASEELAPCKPLFGNVGSFPKGTRTVQDCKRTGNGVSIGLQEDLPQRVGEFPEHVSCKIWSF